MHHRRPAPNHVESQWIRLWSQKDSGAGHHPGSMTVISPYPFRRDGYSIRYRGVTTYAAPFRSDSGIRRAIRNAIGTFSEWQYLVRLGLAKVAHHRSSRGLLIPLAMENEGRAGVYWSPMLAWINPMLSKSAYERRYLATQLCYVGGVTSLLTPDKKTRSL